MKVRIKQETMKKISENIRNYNNLVMLKFLIAKDTTRTGQAKCIAFNLGISSNTYWVATTTHSLL